MHSFFAINRLSAYIDGELPDNEAAEVERAIASDPSVRIAYEQMLDTVETLRSRGPVKAPPDLHALIMARVADEPDPAVGWWARFWAPFRAMPLEAVGVVFAAVAVVVLINQRPGMDTPPADPAPMAVEETVSRDEAEPQPQEPPRLASRPEQPAPPAPEAGLPAKPIGSSAARRSSAAKSSATSSSKSDSQKKSAASKGGADKATYSQQKVVPPKQAYEAEWEKQSTDAGYGTNIDEPSTLRNQPFYYRVVPHDAHGLQQLQKLASKYGGSLKYLDGRTLRPQTLTDGELLEVRADIPSDQVEAFAAALQQLGLVTRIQSDANDLHGGGMTQVRLQVQFNP